MKKTVTAAALIAALTFAGIQTVSANNNRYDSDDNYGPGYCGNYFNRGSNFTKEDQEALEKFNAETATTRREIVVKRSELNALCSWLTMVAPSCVTSASDTATVCRPKLSTA